MELINSAEIWTFGEAPKPVRIKKPTFKGTTFVIATISVIAVSSLVEAGHRYHYRHAASAVECDGDIMRPSCRAMTWFQAREQPRHVSRRHAHTYAAKPKTERQEVAHTQHEAPFGRGVVKASTGAVAYVNERARASMQCLIDKLETAGVRIKEMGGFADHGHIRHSLHYSGLAMDVNQLSRNVTDPPMPSEEIFFAETCGLISGKTWDDADSGHFQLGGYKGKHKDGEIRIAMVHEHHHHHHRHYARRHIRYRYAHA